MQLMPGTGRGLARQLGLPYSLEKLFDPEYSVRLGTRYLRQVLQMFDGREELALASYNGGPGRIRGLWRQAGPQPELDAFLEGLSIEESKNYVKRTLVLADGYRSLYPRLAAGN
jgi:soluble lytic murein transglycosylase